MAERFTNTFFDPDSPYLRHPLLTPARTAAEVDRLEVVLGAAPGARLLDVGCGFGRHSIELGRRGHDVTGVDPSQALIDVARAELATASAPTDLAVRFAVQRADDPIAGDAYDGAICMFTTLGQVATGDEDNRGLLDRVAAALAPGARLVVEVPQRDGAVTALVPADRFGDDTDHTSITRSFDPSTRCVTEAFEVTAAGETTRFDLRYRLFSAEELVGLLTGAGFTDLRLAPDLDGLVGASRSTLEPEDVSMVAVATAPAA